MADEREELDEIGKILEEYQRQRSQRQAEAPVDLEPPKRREESIDFAKEPEKKSEADKKPAKKAEKKKPDSKRAEAKKNRKKNIEAASDKISGKKVLTVVVAIAVIVLGIIIAVNIASSSKTSYLKPYQSKYKDVVFPEGILEEYCDDYGQNPYIVGRLKIDDIGFDDYASEKQSTATAEKCAEGYVQKNYVIYLDSNKLEECYSTADGYNNSSGFIEYSTLTKINRFKVVGAFYTNTKAKDDNRYIFPYNTTEEMTNRDANELIDRLQSRFLYTTSGMMTRQDTLLTISCPTDFHKDFRFVVVAILDNDGDKPKATEKSRVHYPQVIYDENGETNPYRFSRPWYPQVVLRDEESTALSQKAIQEYVKKN